MAAEASDSLKASRGVDDGNESSELSELDSSELSGSESSELSELDSDQVSTPERFRSESPDLMTTSASSSGLETTSSSSSSGFVTTSSSSSSPAELTPLQRLGRRRFHPREVKRAVPADLGEQSLRPSLKKQRLSRIARNRGVEDDEEDPLQSGVPARYRLSTEPTELENTAPSQGMQSDDEPVHRDRFPGRSAPRATVPIRAPGKLAWPGFATTERVTFLSYPPADPAAQRRIEKRLQEAKEGLEQSMAMAESSTGGFPTSDLRTRIDNTQPSSGRAPYSGTSDRERGWCAVAASLGQTVAETKAKVAEWERRNNASRI